MSYLFYILINGIFHLNNHCILDFLYGTFYFALGKRNDIKSLKKEDIHLYVRYLLFK